MATPNSISTRPPLRVRARASEATPVYGTSDGVLSYRYRLKARERGVIDRALAIVGRCLREPGVVTDQPEAAREYMHLHLAGEGRERFAVLFLDCQHRAIAFEILFSGTLKETSVYPREIVCAALAHGAAAVIFAHNHPSGITQPSRADKNLTQALKSALAVVDIQVLDHIIVGGNETLSMAGRGLL